ncbi:MAG: type II secretion system F family protein [Verrucomicrobiales bacterium]|nr:type II secretion system F family protein [Verrucomicrobiales bacterium]
MPAFAYQATDPTGRTVSGSVDAADRATAVRQLSGKGLQPFQIREASHAAAGKNGKASATAAAAKTGSKTSAKKLPTGPIKLSTTQVQLFAEELAELLTAGMRLEPALKLMEGRGELTPHRAAAKRIGDLVREGHPFSQALRQVSPSFGELFCAVAAAGEAGGSLGTAMQRQSAYLAAAREIRGKVSVALIYPAFLLTAALGVSILFATFLIPQLTEMVQSLQGGLPTGIRVLLAVSDFLKTAWPFLLGGVVVLIGSLVAWARSPAGRPAWHRLQLRLPFLGPVLLASFHSQFLETLASLTLGGLPLLRGLELAARVNANTLIRSRIDRATDLVRDGGSLSRALERTELFPQNLIEMIRIGEHTGELGETLRRAADRCAKELGRTLERAVAMMQPVIILMMALLVGVMAYMMISVIFETMNAVRSRH